MMMMMMTTMTTTTYTTLLIHVFTNAVVFQYISNKMQLYTVYLYLETALHVSGGTSTHHQGRIQLYLQHLVFVTPLLLHAAIVEELELQFVSSISSTIAAGSSIVLTIPDAVCTVVYS